MRPPLGLALLLSGFAALVDQIVWVRLLGELFGHTAYALHVVLAVFFGGLALGSWLAGRLRIDARRSLKVFAMVELAIGLLGLLFPAVIDAIAPLHDRLAPTTVAGVGALIWRLGTAALLLAVPTTLMGATLPLARAGRGRDTGVAGLYGANTLGAAAGAWLTGFVLLRAFGVSGALACAAAANAVSAALVWTRPPDRAKDLAPGAPTAADTALPVPALLLAVSGFVGLVLEVLWVRALDQVLSGTIYSVSTVLAVFLVGLAAGNAVYARARRRLPHDLLFTAVQATLAVVVVLTPFVMRVLPPVAAALEQTLGSGFLRRGMVLESLLAAALLLVPTTLMGLALPLLLETGDNARAIGRRLAANTMGSVAGSLAAGLVLLPELGLRTSLRLTAALPLLAATLAAAASPRRAARLVLAAGIAAWALGARLAPPHRVFTRPGERLIAAREDPLATVTVLASGSGPLDLRLQVNNSYSLGGGRGVFTEHRQGHLPMLLHPAPGRVLVLGVGTANTLGAVAAHRPERLVAVDLVCGVLELARRHFHRTNFAVLDDPRVEVRCADAVREARAERERFDVVVGDLFHPWQAGVGALYSREHFEAVRARLAPGGRFCQWLPLYQLSHDSLRTIVRTFLAVFPEGSAWFGNLGASTPVLGLVGGDGPARLSWERWQRAAMDARTGPTLPSVYLDRPAELAGSYVAGADGLAVFAGPGPLNTARRPRLEFEVPGTLFAGSFDEEKRRSLRDLLRLHEGSAASAFHGTPARSDLERDRGVVRTMVHALLAHEEGATERAVALAAESARRAGSYDVPAAVLKALRDGYE